MIRNLHKEIMLAVACLVWAESLLALCAGYGDVAVLGSTASAIGVDFLARNP